MSLRRRLLSASLLGGLSTISFCARPYVAGAYLDIVSEISSRSIIQQYDKLTADLSNLSNAESALERLGQQYNGNRLIVDNFNYLAAQKEELNKNMNSLLVERPEIKDNIQERRDASIQVIESNLGFLTGGLSLGILALFALAGVFSRTRYN